MRTIIFIRHGESVVNTTFTLSSDIEGYPLTGKGRAQATGIASAICNAKITTLYTSPVLRAVQTAQIIAERCGIAPRVDGRLIERRMGGLNNVNFGSRDNLRNAILEEIKSGYKKDLEPWDGLRDRVADFVKGAAAGVTAAVTHRDVILAALAAVDSEYDDYDRETEISQASATTIDFENRRIIGINSKEVPKLDAE
jgi:broad specificity phosphatase PhoE